jgi:Cu(I)/Ag(I) efflux system membrane fusion protein
VPKAVLSGGSAREETLITQGLTENDIIVVSGLFLIDSEANLAGALDRLSPPPTEADNYLAPAADSLEARP